MTIVQLALLLLLAVVAFVAAGCDAMGDMNTYGALWGSYSNFVTADANTGTYPNMNDTVPGNASLRAMGSGAYVSCGLTYASSRPVCWGDPEAASVPSELQSVSYERISVGGYHACALRSSGAIDCWGKDERGETRAPQQQSFAYVAAGWQFSCALTRDEGRAVCWGGKALQPPEGVRFESLYAGSSHACGIQAGSGRAICWGSDTYNRTRAPPSVSFVSLALGVFHSCGVTHGSLRLVCWGDDSFGQIRGAPREEAFASVVAGDFYTCGLALTQLRALRCWGNSFQPSGIAFQRRVSQGVCSASCEQQQQQFRLRNGSGDLSSQCPAAGDAICLPCEAGCIIQKAAVCGCTKLSPGGDGNGGDGGLSKGAIAAVAAGGAAAALLLASAAAGFCLITRRRRRKKARNQSVQSWDDISTRFIAFSSAQLRAATRGFSREMVIGRGAHGTVYKGVLPDGRLVAIKKQSSDGSSSSSNNNKRITNRKRKHLAQETFSQELQLLSRIHHSCLLNLVGYCERERMLVYEFMANGSLADCLFRGGGGYQLGLLARVRVAAQAARGLEYLHSYASPRVIHRDVKPANILLDAAGNARVADFGLSLLGPQAPGATHLSGVAVAGTPGYVDPEYWQTMQLTPRSDVYSFGIVLLELLTGRPALQQQQQQQPSPSGEPQPLLTWALTLVEAGDFSVASLCDPRLLAEVEGREPLVLSVLGLALSCTQARSRDRPSMDAVAASLEAVLLSLKEEEEQHQEQQQPGIRAAAVSSVPVINMGATTSSSSSNFNFSSTGGLDVSSVLSSRA